MSKSRLDILVDLSILENSIYDAGIDGGILTSDAIDALNRYMVSNSKSIITMLREQNLDLLLWKTKYNELISEKNDQSSKH